MQGKTDKKYCGGIVTNVVKVISSCAPFFQNQESLPLGLSNFRSMRRVIGLYSRPIRFVRFDSELAQSDGTSVDRGLPVLDLPRGRDSWC